MKKFIDYAQVTLMVTVIVAGIISLLGQFDGSIKPDEIWDYMYGTVVFMVYSILLFDYLPWLSINKNHMSNSNAQTAIVIYTCLLIVVLAHLYIFLGFAGFMFDTAYMIAFIIWLSFVSGLSHARYSLFVNLLFLTVLFYFGSGIELYLKNLGIGLGLTIISQVFRFTFFYKWSRCWTLTEEQKPQTY
jgi:hypothetical protein